MADPNGPVVEQRGLWFEEMIVGARYLHRPGRTISEADNTWFSSLTMNQQALHMDEVFSAEQEFGTRLVNSMMTLSMVVGLSVGQLTQGTLVANLGLTDVTFPHPLRHGDTLYAETEIVDKRPSKSRPGQGIVHMQHRGYNQSGDLVAEATRQALVRMAPR